MIFYFFRITQFIRIFKMNVQSHKSEEEEEEEEGEEKTILWTHVNECKN